jgi:RES domain-containing protein
MLVNAPSSLLPFYLAIPVTFDDSLVEKIDAELLPRSWRTNPSPSVLARLGNRWLTSGSSAVLQVPSAVIPHEPNFLLNPGHPDFPAIKIGDPFEVTTDPRLRRAP